MRHEGEVDIVEAADADKLIERYQALLSNLLLRRAVEGPLPDKEEAGLAQEQADLWDIISRGAARHFGDVDRRPSSAP